MSKAGHETIIEGVTVKDKAFRGQPLLRYDSHGMYFCNSCSCMVEYFGFLFDFMQKTKFRKRWQDYSDLARCADFQFCLTAFQFRLLWQD